MDAVSFLFIEIISFEEENITDRRTVYNPHAEPSTDILPILQGFQQELSEWRTSAPVIQTCLHYSTAYYDFLYNSALQLLYRPSILNPNPDSNCIVQCGNASILVIQSYWENYSVGKIKWLWITLSHIFSAGVTMLWCLEQDIRAIHQGMPPFWDNPQVYSSLEFVDTLLDEFRARHKAADRLISQFKSQSQKVTQRMAQAAAEQKQQQQQQQTLEAMQQQLLPTFMTPLPIADSMLAVHPMFYNYGWVGQEVASFYGL